jgi:hypothetical protein
MTQIKNDHDLQKEEENTIMSQLRTSKPVLRYISFVGFNMSVAAFALVLFCCTILVDNRQHTNTAELNHAIQSERDTCTSNL